MGASSPPMAGPTRRRFQKLSLESFRKEGYTIPLDVEPLPNKFHKNILALNIVLFFYIKEVYFIYN